jgi:hypothetical protein
MIKSVLTLLGIFLLTVGAAAQNKKFETKESAISDIDFYASNTGLFGVSGDKKSPGFVVPRGSGKCYLFGGGLWFGARKRMLDSSGSPVWRPLVFLGYNPGTATGWATPGEGFMPNASPARPDLYRSGDYNRRSGEALMPSNPPAPHWPLWASSTSTIRTLTPGIFEPFDSLRKGGGTSDPYKEPAFVPGVDEQLVARYHDADLNSYESNAFALMEGYPIGLQIQQNIYAWGMGRYRHTVVIQYDIINMSGDTLLNCVAAQASDPDIGYPDNDRVRYYDQRPELRAACAWTDPDSMGMYDTLAMIMLEAPMVNGDGFIDNARRRDFKLQGSVGSFPYWMPKEEPHTSAERYDFITRGDFADDKGPADQHAIMASRIFSMRPGDTAHFAVAYAVLDDTFYRTTHGEDTTPVTNQDANPRLEAWAASLTNDYYAGSFASTSVSVDRSGEAGARALSVLPNPAADMTGLRFTLAARSEVRLRIVNSIGQEVGVRSLGVLDAGLHGERIETAGLAPGAYLIVLENGAESRTARLNVVR